jgi:hypothetical protein
MSTTTNQELINYLTSLKTTNNIAIEQKQNSILTAQTDNDYIDNIVPFIPTDKQELIDLMNNIKMTNSYIVQQYQSTITELETKNSEFDEIISYIPTT